MTAAAAEPGRRAGLRLGAREAYWLVLAAGYLVTLSHDLPGFLSVDSVLALHEGHFRVRETWQPALFSWLLGIFDHIQEGTALYVIAQAVVPFVSWAALTRVRPGVSWAAPIVALALVLTPQVLIYQGIVWKDVAFANAAVAGYVCLALADRPERRRGAWLWFVLAALLLAAAGLLRQNGLVLLAPAALAAGWTFRSRGWLRAAALAGLWAVAVAVFTLVLSAVAQPQGFDRPDNGGSKGVRILLIYDLFAAEAGEPGRPLPHVARAAPDVAAYIRHNAGRIYSPERVDTFLDIPELGPLLQRIPDSALHAEWFDLVTHDTGLYLKARLAAFRWVFATPVIDRCLPVYFGVDGPPKEMGDLKLVRRWDDRDQRLLNYATWFMDTPALSHVAAAVLAAAVAGVLAFRRQPGDMAMIAMQLGALGFAASFFVISLACDYRYLYFLDLAAISGALYLAIDPAFWRRR